MSFAIIRAKKYKTGQHIRAVANHNFRTEPIKPSTNPKNKPKFDASKSYLNVYIGAKNPDEEMVAIRERIKTCTRKPRPDANKIVEFVMTASPAYFKDQPIEFSKKYLDDCLEFAGVVFGPDNIVSAQMHFDEKTPHIHIKAVPLETSVRKTKHTSKEVTVLNAKHFTNGHEKMIELQDKFYEFIKAKGHDLERGISKSITNAIHQETAEWYEQQDALLAQRLEQATAKERNANEAMASLLEVKKENGILVQKSIELNADTGRREKALTKEKEDFEALQSKRDAFFKRESDRLDAFIAVTNENASKVRALLKQSQEVKDVLADPATLQVVQCIKSNDRVRNLVFRVTQMDEDELTNASVFINPPELQPVDRTDQFDHDYFLAGLDRGPRYDAPDYSQS